MTYDLVYTQEFDAVYKNVILQTHTHSRHETGTRVLEYGSGTCTTRVINRYSSTREFPFVLNNGGHIDFFNLKMSLLFEGVTLCGGGM